MNDLLALPIISSVLTVPRLVMLLLSWPIFEWCCDLFQACELLNLFLIHTVKTLQEIIWIWQPRSTMTYLKITKNKNNGNDAISKNTNINQPNCEFHDWTVSSWITVQHYYQSIWACKLMNLFSCVNATLCPTLVVNLVCWPAGLLVRLSVTHYF